MAPANGQKQQVAPSDDELKRPQNAYFFFAAEVKPDVIAKLKAHSVNDGKVDISQVSKEISNLWAQADAETKAKYEAMAAGSKAEYLRASSCPVAALNAKYASLIPKKPLGLWMLYVQDPSNRKHAEEALKKEEKAVNMKTLTAKLSVMWKLLTPEEKEPLVELHKKSLAEYDEKRKIWEARPEFAELAEAHKKASADKKRKTLEHTPSELKPAEHDVSLDKEAMTETKRSKAMKKADDQNKVAAAAEMVIPQKPENKNAPPRPTKGASKPEDPQIDEKVLNEARSLGFELEYRNLHRRPEVQGKGISDQEMLDALQLSDGLVNRAKEFLLHPFARFTSLCGQ